MAGYFYAFADAAAAVTAGALVESGDGHTLAHPQAVLLRETGIALTEAVVDPETREIVTPAMMSAPLVILTPEMLPGCSAALIDPPGHQGFA